MPWKYINAEVIHKYPWNQHLRLSKAHQLNQCTGERVHLYVDQCLPIYRDFFTQETLNVMFRIRFCYHMLDLLVIEHFLTLSFPKAVYTSILSIQ